MHCCGSAARIPRSRYSSSRSTRPVVALPGVLPPTGAPTIRSQNRTVRWARLCALWGFRIPYHATFPLLIPYHAMLLCWSVDAAVKPGYVQRSTKYFVVRWLAERAAGLPLIATRGLIGSRCSSCSLRQPMLFLGRLPPSFLRHSAQCRTSTSRGSGMGRMYGVLEVRRSTTYLSLPHTFSKRPSSTHKRKVPPHKPSMQVRSTTKYNTPSPIRSPSSRHP